MNDIHTRLARAGFVRPAENRIVGGVCAGLAARYGLDAWAVRALLILALVALPGSQVILYPIAWILMPASTPVAHTHPATAPTSSPAPATSTGPQDVLR